MLVFGHAVSRQKKMIVLFLRNHFMYKKNEINLFLVDIKKPKLLVFFGCRLILETPT
jgi:hypothetical protein